MISVVTGSKPLKPHHRFVVILHLISGFATKALSLFLFGCSLAIVGRPSEIQNGARVLSMEGSAARWKKWWTACLYRSERDG